MTPNVSNLSVSDCLSMQIDLHNVTTWSQHWNLNFNAAKCALLQLSSGCPPTAFIYILNGDLFSAQETHRDLGIIVPSDLSWREHVKIFYPQHMELSTLLDIYSALVTVLKPRRFFICP